MIFFILAGSMFLTGAMGFTGIPRQLAVTVGEQGYLPGQILLVLTLLMIVLGCFIDGISIVVLTTSVLMPVIEAAKIDPLWFGIYMVFVVEMGLVTPPVGFNLFVIQGLTKRDLPYISWAALPYFFAMCVAVAIVVVLPPDRHLVAGADDRADAVAVGHRFRFGNQAKLRLRSPHAQTSRQTRPRHGWRPGHRARHQPPSARRRLRCICPLSQQRRCRPRFGGRARCARPADTLALPLISRIRPNASVVVGEAVEFLGGLDVLVNNAGSLVARRTQAEADDAFWAEVMSLNVDSARRVTRIAAPHLRRSETGGGAQHRQPVSLAGRKGGHPGSLVYSTAKGAVLTFTRALANELGPLGVRVNALRPRPDSRHQLSQHAHDP